MRRVLATLVLALTLFSSAPAIAHFPPVSLVVHIQGNPNVTVWVNTNSGVYHCAGTRWYGNTRQGRYMKQKEAQTAGYRPAYGSNCG